MISGQKSLFAFEVGEITPVESDLRQVDIWAGDRFLTCDDNTVYIPQFCNSVEYDIRRIENPDKYTFVRGISPQMAHRQFNDSDGVAFRDHLFMNWGPTADNIISLLFRDSDTFHMTFEFWREGHSVSSEIRKIFQISLPADELRALLSKLVSETKNGYKQNHVMDPTRFARGS